MAERSYTELGSIKLTTPRDCGGADATHIFTSSCEECGAVVVSPKKHDEWHDEWHDRADEGR